MPISILVWFLLILVAQSWRLNFWKNLDIDNIFLLGKISLSFMFMCLELGKLNQMDVVWIESKAFNISSNYLRWCQSLKFTLELFYSLYDIFWKTSTVTLKVMVFCKCLEKWYQCACSKEVSILVTGAFSNFIKRSMWVKLWWNVKKL